MKFEMEQISCGPVCDRFPPLKARYPCLISQNLEDDNQDQYFYTIHDELPHYQCLPELLGKLIQGCFHGCIVLSNHPQNNEWSLWNQVTSKIISLPTLILEDGNYESIGHCCLSAPPNDPSSVLLLARTNKPTFVFCQLGSKRDKFRWTEMSYAKQLKRLSFDGELLHNLTCCTDKVYALSTDGSFTDLVIQVDIRVREKEVVITLMLFGACPPPSYSSCRCSGGDIKFYLKGSCAELFYIIYYENKSLKTSADVCLFKLDMTSVKWEELEGLKDWDISDLRFDDWVYDDYTLLHKSHQIWEEIDDLKNANLFLDLSRDQSVSYSRSELGGYVHIRDKMGKTIYSYHVKDKTISQFPIPPPILPTSHVSIWECRLADDHEKAKCIVNSKVETENNSEILFRSNYSVASPWLMVVNKNRDVITFNDPMFGDKYLMKNFPISIACDKIFSSRFGWLLFRSNDLKCLVLYNPFTNDLRKLPQSEYIYDMESLNFSAPPTSPDCIVVGFTTREVWDVHIHFVNRKPTWRIFRLGPDPHTICCSSFYGRDLYALCGEGEVIVFNNLGKRGYSLKIVEAEAPESVCGSWTQKFLTKCDQHLLLVYVSGFGEHVEVFKLNEVKQAWEKITGVGKHVIYICRTTCLCLEAKTPQMENKIFFPRVSTENRKIVFYSLDTCMYHTFDGENIQQPDLFGTTSYLSSHAWIEPSWL